MCRGLGYRLLGLFTCGSGGSYFSVGRSGRNLAEQFSEKFFDLSRLRNVNSLSFPDVNIAVFPVIGLDMIKNLIKYAYSCNTHILKTEILQNLEYLAEADL